MRLDDAWNRRDHACLSMRDSNGVGRMAMLSSAFWGSDEEHFLHHANEIRRDYKLRPLERQDNTK